MEMPARQLNSANHFLTSHLGGSERVCTGRKRTRPHQIAIKLIKIRMSIQLDLERQSATFILIHQRSVIDDPDLVCGC